MEHVETRAQKRRRYAEGAQVPWTGLPAGPLQQILEFASRQPRGTGTVHDAALVCKEWYTAATDVILQDTACSRRCPTPQPSQPPKQVDSTAACASLEQTSRIGMDVSSKVQAEGDMLLHPPLMKLTPKATQRDLRKERRIAKRVAQGPSQPGQAHTTSSPPGAPRKTRARR